VFFGSVDVDGIEATHFITAGLRWLRRELRD
jgi:hypothetical protein